MHNRYRSNQAPGDPRLEEAAALSMRENPVLLNADMRATVLSTIQDHCQIKAWRLIAINVRTNHVHVVLNCGEVRPSVALEQFKSWSTRRLRDAVLIARDAPVWSRGGSKRHVYSESHLQRVVNYVLNGQDESK